MQSEANPLMETELHLGVPKMAAGVEVQVIGSVRARRGHLWRARKLSGVGFFFLSSGEISLDIDGNASATLAARDIYVVFPGRCVTISVLTENARFIYMELCGDRVVQSVLRIGYWNCFHATLLEDELEERLCAVGRLIDDSHAKGKDRQVLVQVEQILDAAWLENDFNRRNPMFAEAIRTLHNLKVGELSAKNALDALGVSRSGLNQMFLRALRIRPGAYFSEVKLDIVKELLSDRSLNISYIAQISGFSSGSAFACFFRRKTGVSPLFYRR